MATWMAHLRVAEKLLPHWPDLDPGQFAYGSLAPDFGKPLGEGKFYPPKDISHYYLRIDDRSVFQDLRFYREYLAHDQVKRDNPRYSFTLGYFFHLVMDGLWSAWIGQASKRDNVDMIEELGEEAWWNMKDDWYGLDVQYTQENRDGIFWSQVMAMKELPLYLDFQDHDIVQAQVKRIQMLYSDPPIELAERAEFPYLSEKTLDRYVEDSAAFLLEYYRMLQENGVPDGCDTFQDLFAPERFSPYPAPLGD
jgi:hypothetical protein